MVRTIISFGIFILILSVNLKSLDTSFLHACTSTLRKPISNQRVRIIKRVHSMKIQYFIASHEFRKLTSFTRHQNTLNIPKQNLICSSQYHRGVSNTKVYGKAVRDAKNVIFKETTLLIFKSGHNFSRMAISDLFYAGKKFG